MKPFMAYWNNGRQSGMVVRYDELQELDSELNLLARVYAETRTEPMPIELQKRIEYLIGAYRRLE